MRLLDGLKVGDGDKTDEAGAKGGGGRRRGKAPAAATVVKTKERVAGGGDGPEATNQGGADAAIAAAGGGGRYCRFELDYDSPLPLLTNYMLKQAQHRGQQAVILSQVLASNVTLGAEDIVDCEGLILNFPFFLHLP